MRFEDLLIAQPSPARFVPGPRPDPDLLGELDLWAPPWLPAELALLAAGILIAPFNRRLRYLPLLAPVEYALYKARQRAVRASVRRLGVTPATAPRMRIDQGIWLLLLGGLVWRLTHPAPQPAHWTIGAAATAARQPSDRRSWNRAYAAALKASQD